MTLLTDINMFMFVLLYIPENMLYSKMCAAYTSPAMVLMLAQALSQLKCIFYSKNIFMF